MSTTRMSEENDFQSNRPYTLFYYPSSRLPPCTMSEDEVCHLWCLIDDERKAFPVNAGLRWNVAGLTKAIRQERSRLQTIDIIDLVLWKLNDPIPVDDIDDTLPQLLSKPITNSSVELGKPAQKLSDVFPDLPEDHLHIIVKLPDQALERSAKRVKLEHESDKSLESFRNFRNYHWGENRFKLRTEGGKTFSTLDLTPANIPELNRRSIKILFIRDEYTVGYNAIVERISEMGPEERVALLFTGQPGTGKTLFLLVLLVLILREKQVVALQINPDEFVLFDESGVSKHGKHDNHAVPNGAWTLSDSQSHEPCTAFQFSSGHLIHTSSPASGRWKEWVKQVSAKRYIMDVWSPEEFRILLTISNINIPRGETLFIKYGSNVEHIVDILKDPEEEATYDLDVKSGAADIAKDFSTILLQLERLDFKSKLSSKIFATLVTAVSHQTVAEQHLIFTLLTAHPSLGTAAGWCISNPPSIPAPKTVLVGSTALRKIQPPFDFYWRPRESNFEGINGLIRVGNTVRVQQYTTSSSHRSATKGLEEIREIMNHIRDVDWHFDIVGPDLSPAESARDSHKLTGRWAKTAIYASQLQIGILDKQMLERILNEATDDIYPEYRMDSTTGFQISSSSTPVHVPSAPYHQSAQVSTRRKAQKQSKTLSTSTDMAAPHRRLRNQK